MWYPEYIHSMSSGTFWLFLIERYTKTYHDNTCGRPLSKRHVTLGIGQNSRRSVVTKITRIVQIYVFCTTERVAFDLFANVQEGKSTNEWPAAILVVYTFRPWRLMMTISQKVKWKKHYYMSCSRISYSQEDVWHWDWLHRTLNELMRLLAKIEVLTWHF